MRRFRRRRDHLEAPSMLERGNAGARRRDIGEVDLGHHDAGLGAALGDDAAPGVEDEGMAESLAPVTWLPGLRSGEHIAGVLRRACRYKDMPKPLAGLSREGGGDCQERRA